jgi:release factor glutamine methyltransferase
VNTRQTKTTSNGLAWPAGAGPAAFEGEKPTEAAPCLDAKTSKFVWSLDRTSDVGRAILAASRRLRESGSDTPQLDSAILMAHVLGVSRAWLYAHPSRGLPEEEIGRFEKLVRRRMCHEPVAYLVGSRPFYGLDITVDRRVLIPRPETELLVDQALIRIRRLVAEGVQPRVADIGTGSGAIAVALAVNAPEAQLYAVDLSADALEVAEQNIWRYGLSGQVQLLPGSLLDPLRIPVDLIVANLPYIPAGEIAGLAPQIRDYEPMIALDGGQDGLRLFRALFEAVQAPAAKEKLRAGAQMILEIGAGQGQAVSELAEEMLPSSRVEVRLDHAALDRLVIIDL